DAVHQHVDKHRRPAQPARAGRLVRLAEVDVAAAQAKLGVADVTVGRFRPPELLEAECPLQELDRRRGVLIEQIRSHRLHLLERRRRAWTGFTTPPFCAAPSWLRSATAAASPSSAPGTTRRSSAGSRCTRCGWRPCSSGRTGCTSSRRWPRTGGSRFAWALSCRPSRPPRRTG